MAQFVWIYPATYLPRWLTGSSLAGAILRRRGSFRSLGFMACAGSCRPGGGVGHSADGGRWGNVSISRSDSVSDAFSVVLVTLVGAGLLLPAVIRALGLANAGAREHTEDQAQEFKARQQAVEAALKRLEELGAERRPAGQRCSNSMRSRHW